jgi:hypothetical protein
VEALRIAAIGSGVVGLAIAALALVAVIRSGENPSNRTRLGKLAGCATPPRRSRVTFSDADGGGIIGASERRAATSRVGGV